MLRVVLVAEDVRRPPGLQRGADAVGADEFLGVVEARREFDAVEMAFEIVIGGQPGQHEPVGVGEDDADRLAVELFVQVPEHRVGVPGQGSLRIGIAGVPQLDPVGRDPPVTGAAPGRENRLAHLMRAHRLRGQEFLPGLGQPGTAAHGLQRHCCVHHGAS